MSINDEQVPLAVVLDDDINQDADLTTIEDEETPLAKAKSGIGGRVWWYWILIIISAFSAKIARDKKKEVVDAINIEDDDE